MYADDVALIAETEGELKEMIRRLKRYLEKKKLILSAEKSKVMVFEKSKRKEKREWMLKDKRIEEVKEIKYLEYILQKNGRQEQLKENFRKAMMAMKSTWSIGERLFKKDFRRRMKMFKLVKSVTLYGAEIWGWLKEERLDNIQRKYVKWILNLERITPNYLIDEECKLKNTSWKEMKRVVKYEKKARRDKRLIKD